MIRLGLRLRAGRYHATPWDHHVNEGVVEWPPSPWRLLRAMVSALHTRAHGASPAVAARAIRKLSAAPSYTLPPASVGHTRHYLSLNALKRSDSAMVFDTFVAVDPSATVIVHWPCELDREERDALDAIAHQVSYLGRAESWADLEVLADDAVTPPPNCAPSNGAAVAGTVTVRALCPADDVTLADLERSTEDLHREGWSDPPGSRQVFYRRASEALSAQLRAPAVVRGASKPTIAEFSLGGAVLPRLVDAVRIGERFRLAVMSYWTHRRGEAVSETITGKRGSDPRTGRHEHAHFLPDARPVTVRGQTLFDRVSHVVVWAPEGFGEVEQEALRYVRYLRLPWRDGGDAFEDVNRAGGGSDDDLRVVLNGFGDARDLAGESSLFARSTRWRSRTPFVLPRHVKAKRAADQPEAQLRRELSLRTTLDARGEPVPFPEVRVEASGQVRLGPQGRAVPWLEFRRWRDGDTLQTGAVGFALEFDEPVAGPLALGYGSHYGLGQFEAEP